MLERVDRLIGYLMGSLLSRHLDHCVNLIVLADHGTDGYFVLKLYNKKNSEKNIAINIYDL